MLTTAIATVCLSGTLREKFEAIAAAGFQGIELFEMDLTAFNGSPAEVKQMADDLGLKIVTYQPFRDFEGLPEPYRTQAFYRAEQKFKLLNQLGCDLLMICSNTLPYALGGIDRAANDLRELGERAAKYGIRLAYEALAWGKYVHDYRDSWEIVRRANHPNVGLTLDSFHVLARNTDLSMLATIPGDKIFLVQMADAPMMQLDYLTWARHYRSMPGQGELDIDGFMKALAATSFDGLLSLEIFSDRFRAGSARSVALDGKRSLLNLIDDMLRAQGRSLPAFPAMPPRAQCAGVEFIEFAVDDAGAIAFAKILQGLGFTHKSQHRSKAVSRWQQGEVNILLNSDHKGFADKHFTLHGTSVCAITLRVDDARATFERAQGLQEEAYRQKVSPGELEIPTIRSPGGSLLYFIDRKTKLGQLWDIDFKENTNTANPSAVNTNLTRVDHISQSMPHEDMLSWLLFHTTLLDVKKTVAQAVIDPRGVVQSQVVENESGSLRLPFNASQGRQTLSSRFINDYFGAGVQHIAFASENIIKSVEQMRANGVNFLPVPANYYDDLEARGAFTAAETVALRRNNILFDRDDKGVFFQAYTASMEHGFFFEIVERRDGYQGYGAANAPIRLAAQTRLAPDVGGIGAMVSETQ